MESQAAPRNPYPSDVSDEERAFVASYLTLMTPDAPHRRYDLRDVFNATRWIVRSGAPWRYLPTNFLPSEAVYQQAMRWTEGREVDSHSRVRTHLADERTFLAWLRTGLGMTGLGLAAA